MAIGCNTIGSLPIASNNWMPIPPPPPVSELAGMVILMASPNVPTGYLECNGDAVSREDYAALYAEIGSLYGDGDGSTTFNLPDLRGEFVRGWDHQRNVDPNRNIGSTQTDEFKAHSHQYGGVTVQGDDPDYRHNELNTHGSSYSTSITGGNETRPRNIALMYCIKY